MFLQTGLGLTRSEWDYNFNALNRGGYNLQYPQNLPWMDFDPNAWKLSSSELPRELWQGWTQINKDHPGYVAGLDCYIWGYRPPDVAESPLFGVGSVMRRFGVGGLGALPGPFNVCTFNKECLFPPAANCPAPAPCPGCPPVPECSELTPECPPCATMPTIAPTKYGVNVGLLVAGALTAGVGYYGYRKGWFRKKA